LPPLRARCSARHPHASGNPGTNFDTYIWLVSSCPHGPTSVNIYDLGLLVQNDDTPDVGVCSTLVYFFPGRVLASPTTLYLLVEGFSTLEGRFELSITTTGLSTGPSPSPPACPGEWL
jgi:hypothetical protein